MFVDLRPSSLDKDTQTFFQQVAQDNLEKRGINLENRGFNTNSTASNLFVANRPGTTRGDETRPTKKAIASLLDRR